MSQKHATEDLVTERDDPERSTVTEYDSKITMLRAERHDEITIDRVVTVVDSAHEIPDSLRVQQRNSTYFGPKLKLTNGVSDYMLTAPGPDSDLLLWSTKTDNDGFRDGWQKLAEVTTSFADQQPQYDLCPYCGDPLKTLEHERRAGVGQCSGDD
ncbi:hypothetical protein [Haloarcula sp. JP-L23]|uniref:hypothetical protein n=1 Tax=Haloarcula sp. JP-L23 TaxID=2716717 RepID=UPI00140ED55F|nr:hypothetical protein G9465_22265 [Haloarcula sp. JP-L23]